jgi:hypothetical protein
MARQLEIPSIVQDQRPLRDVGGAAWLMALISLLRRRAEIINLTMRHPFTAQPTQPRRDNSEMNEPEARAGAMAGLARQPLELADGRRPGSCDKAGPGPAARGPAKIVMGVKQSHR